MVHITNCKKGFSNANLPSSSFTTPLYIKRSLYLYDKELCLPLITVPLPSLSPPVPTTLAVDFTSVAAVTTHKPLELNIAETSN
ncbi:hypothetical protein QL285_018036 [Trifolium repens]|nr:hypothetical protein QL285_018036 [Trifolium repens]